MIEKRFPDEVARLERQHGLPINCNVVTPEQLLARLGLAPLDPPPLRDGWFYDLSGASEPVIFVNNEPLSERRGAGSLFRRALHAVSRLL